MTYSVKECFYTLQGEGAQSGRAAVFLRFAGCNLWSGLERDRASALCKFCDTDFVGVDGDGGGKFTSPDAMAAHVAAKWGGASGKPYVVCTGGEPLLQLDEVLIAATRKEKVEDRIAVAEAAGLKAAVMDVESYAQQSALLLVCQALPGAGKDQNIAIVDIGANVMSISVLRNDQSVYTREQAFGGNQLTADIQNRYGMSTEEAENAKRSGGLPDDFESEVLRPFMENLSMEVQRALQFFFTSTQFSTVDHILLAGGSAVISGLDEVVNTRTQVNTVVANPFATMETSPRIQLKKLMLDAPSLIIACGLAMRRFDP